MVIETLNKLGKQSILFVTKRPLSTLRDQIKSWLRENNRHYRLNTNMDFIDVKLDDRTRITVKRIVSDKDDEVFHLSGFEFHQIYFDEITEFTEFQVEWLKTLKRLGN